MEKAQNQLQIFLLCYKVFLWPTTQLTTISTKNFWCFQSRTPPTVSNMLGYLREERSNDQKILEIQILHHTLLREVRTWTWSPFLRISNFTLKDLFFCMQLKWKQYLEKVCGYLAWWEYMEWISVTSIWIFFHFKHETKTDESLSSMFKYCSYNHVYLKIATISEGVKLLTPLSGPGSGVRNNTISSKSRNISQLFNAFGL